MIYFWIIFIIFIFKISSYQKLFYLYLFTEYFVKFLHVCSIQTMKAEGFQFETQHK